MFPSTNYDLILYTIYSLKYTVLYTPCLIHIISHLHIHAREPGNLAAVGDLETVLGGSDEESARSISSQAALGETSPELTLVVAAGQSLVGIDDGVTGLEEVRAAGLQGKAIKDELERQPAAVSGHTLGVELGELGAGVAVLADEVPKGFVQDSSPDRADGVDLTVAVDGAVLVGVDGEVSSVRVCTDALALVDVVAKLDNSLRSVCGLSADTDGKHIGPTLAHAARLGGAQAAVVARAAGKAVRKTVSVLVDDDTLVQSTIAVGGGVVEDVHAHARGLAIDGRGKVSVVGASAVLNVEADGIAALASLAVVVELEVTSSLSEAKRVKHVVVLVGGVEELGDGGVGVRLGRLREIQREVVHAVVDGRAVLVQVTLGILARRVAVVGVALRVTVVAARGLVVGGAVAEPAKGGSVDVPRIREDGAVTAIRVRDVPRVDVDGLAGVSNVVKGSVHLATVRSVNKGDDPVVADVGFDSPDGLDCLGVGDEVAQADLGGRDSASGLLDDVLIALLLGDGSLRGIDRKVEDLGGTLERLQRRPKVAPRYRASLRQLALEETVTEGEDGAIARVDVDSEVAVVDVDAMDSLLHVDVCNAVASDVAVIQDAELKARHGALDKVSSMLDVSSAGRHGSRRILAV